MPYSIKWNRNALRQFEKAIAYIEDDSFTNADKFKRDILTKIDGLINHPQKYPPDKYKKNNDGSFRAFEIHTYRISYRFKKNDIRLIRIRHTKMNPLNY